MNQLSGRNDQRFKVALPAIAIDSKRKLRIPCIIRDGSISGCKIVSSSVDEIPDEIYLKIPDLKETIKGSIVWRNGKMAGVEFDWEAMPDNCRRGAPRREVNIPAVLFDLNFNFLSDCTICDASKTGCRIVAEDAKALPHEFRIKIQGLTEPVMVRHVWRKGEMMGLEFFWDSEVYTLDDSFD